MKFKDVLKTKAYKLKNFTQKNSPEILVIAGSVGVLASLFLACRATLKVNDILETKEATMAAITDSLAENREDYTQEDGKKDTAIVCVQTVTKLVGVYAPSAVLCLTSLGLILTSNHILRKRNLSLAAAYAIVDKGFKEYRKRVVEKYGADVDRDLKYNIKHVKTDDVIVDENGKKTKVIRHVAGDPNQYSCYAKFFDESSIYWEKSADYNFMFVSAAQNHANDKLRATGRLFLNEVYKSLGIPETKAGQVVGWVYDPENPKGDNYVDFGMFEVDREVSRDFVNGYERTFILDFNVDGNVWDLMDQ